MFLNFVFELFRHFWVARLRIDTSLKPMLIFSYFSGIWYLIVRLFLDFHIVSVFLDLFICSPALT